MTSRPWLLVIGGINGAGKSTAATEYARSPGMQGASFLNPDEAAQAAAARDPTLSPGAANFRGLRDVREEIARLIKVKKSLVLETVLANVTIIRICREAKAVGYGVRLVFVGVPTAEEAIQRVADRVAKGGHDVLEKDIRRRWPLTHANLGRLVPIADEVSVVANAGHGRKPVLAAQAKEGRVTILYPGLLPAMDAVLQPLVS